MGLLSTLLGGPVSAVVEGVTGIVSRGQERRIAQDAVKGRIAEAKQQGNQEIALKREEWDAIAIGKSGDTWKDEYALLVVTLPFVLIIAGGVWGAFSEVCTTVDGAEVCKPDTRLLDGVVLGLEKLAEMGVQLGVLMMIVIPAAMGIKAGMRALGR